VNVKEGEDISLIERCRANDDTAWRFLVAKYSSMVYTVAYRFTGNRQSSEDLTQEIFMRLYTAIKNFDTGKDFKFWLLRVAKNRCIDDYRKRRAQRPDVSLDAENAPPVPVHSTPFTDYARKEKSELLRLALERLPEDMKVAVVLRDIEGASYEEISRMLGVALGTVKSRINRGRIELARMLSTALRGKP
jgi:RNA polymerase sigma-70 factor (ECF subfamily)